MDPKLSATVSRKKEKDGLDNYPTPPKVTRALFEYGKIPFNEKDIIWDPGCGQGHMLKVFQEYGYEVRGSDIKLYENRIEEFKEIIGELNFLKSNKQYKDMANWIITNPPNFCSMNFAMQALRLAKDGCCIMTRLLWCETKERFEVIFKENRPTKVIVFPERIGMIEGELVEKISSGICYAWYIWEKNKMGNHICELDWFPSDISHLEDGSDYVKYGEYQPDTEQYILEF